MIPMIRTLQVGLAVFFAFLMLHSLFTKAKGIVDVFRFFIVLGLLFWAWMLFNKMTRDLWKG